MTGCWPDAHDIAAGGPVRLCRPPSPDCSGWSAGPARPHWAAVGCFFGPTPVGRVPLLRRALPLAIGPRVTAPRVRIRASAGAAPVASHVPRRAIGPETVTAEVVVFGAAIAFAAAAFALFAWTVILAAVSRGTGTG